MLDKWQRLQFLHTSHTFSWEIPSIKMELYLLTLLSCWPLIRSQIHLASTSNITFITRVQKDSSRLPLIWHNTWPQLKLKSEQATCKCRLKHFVEFRSMKQNSDGEMSIWERYSGHFLILTSLFTLYVAISKYGTWRVQINPFFQESLFF